MKKPQPLYRQIAWGVLLAFVAAFLLLFSWNGITTFFAHPSEMKITTSGGELTRAQKDELLELLRNDSTTVPTDTIGLN